ncbi:MAG: hypothetical protein K0R75_2339 [Paenibacillaceae bacterium]|jgi:ABC-2 type transport system permease protein|nr:hypothetical protein [Paenibacillaceae bacterium]
MHSLYANSLNEAEKIWKRPRTKGFLLLILSIPVVAALLLALLKSSTGTVGALGSDLPMILLNLFTFAVLPLFIFMTVSDIFSGEEAARILKLSLVRPITRAKAYASKVAALAFWVAVQLAGLWIVSFLAEWLSRGGVSGGADSIKAYAAAFVPMLAIGLIAVFVAQWFSNSSGAMAVMIGIYAAAKLLSILVPPISVWSVYSYTNWHVLWVGNGASIGKLFNTFVLLLSYSIMAYIAGLIRFENKQL